MTEAQSALAFALKLYGDATVAYFKDTSEYGNMCFWQEQVAHCAQDVAKEQV